MTLGCPGGFSGPGPIVPRSFSASSWGSRIGHRPHFGLLESFGSAFGVILGALALFFGPFRFTRAFQMRSGLHFGTLWTPKSMLPSRREHRFQKISVSAIYLHFGLKIPSQSDLLDAQMALKTRPKRLKSAPRRSWRRFLAVSGGLLERSWVPLGRFGALRALLGVQKSPQSASKAPQERSQTLLETLFGRLWVPLGAFLGALWPFWNAQDLPGGTPALVWDQFLKDLAWIWRFVRQRMKVFTTSLR